MTKRDCLMFVVFFGMIWLEYFIGYHTGYKQGQEDQCVPTYPNIQKAIDETDANYKCNDCEIKGLYNSNEQPLNTPGVYTQTPEEAKR